MENKSFNQLRHLAKGAFQERILYDLANHGVAVFKDNVACTKHYGRYVDSFNSIYSRLKNNGLNVKLKLGSRNGYWTSKIILID